MSSGGTAGLVTGAGVTFTAGAVAAGGAAGFAGAAAGLAVGGVVAAATATATATTVVGAGDDEDFVSTALPIAGAESTEGAAFVAMGEMAGASGASLASGAALGNGAGLGAGAFLSVTATGAFGGPAQPEINSAKKLAVTQGTCIQNVFV